VIVGGCFFVIYVVEVERCVFVSFCHPLLINTDEEGEDEDEDDEDEEEDDEDEKMKMKMKCDVNDFGRSGTFFGEYIISTPLH